jgi:regulator of sigma E protease
LAAKKFKVFVEEFGIGYPPRIFGKKIGETIYSINLLPFGAFVKLEEEIGRERGFAAQPISKRAIIVLAGVISFWLISCLIFIFLFKFGTPVAIDDEEISENARVEIIGIAKNSPAKIGGLKVGDRIEELKIRDSVFKIEKVKELQKLIQEHKGEKIVLKIERGKEVFELELVPRVSPPEGEGPLGIVLARIEVKKYSLFESIGKGIETTLEMTFSILKGYFLAIENFLKGKPTGVELTGPVGIFEIMFETSKLGWGYFFNLLATISIYLAIFNLLPIPALDGGKLLFLGIEIIRKKPVNEETERKVTALFFTLLIILMIFVTIKDIARLF